MSARKGNRTVNTQLTDPMTYNVNNIIFDDAIASEIGKVKTHRITIGTKNPDGTEGELIMGLDKCLSYGVQENRDDKTNQLQGYSISISLKDREGATERQEKTIEILDQIVEKCKDHLLQMNVKKSIAKITLDRSELKKISPIWRKINPETGEVDESAIPAIYPKLIYAKEREDSKTKEMLPARIITKFYLAEEVDENGDPMVANPLDFIGKRSTVSCALKIESIFVGQVIKLQCKVVEVDIKPLETKPKRLLTNGWSSFNTSNVSVGSNPLLATYESKEEIKDEDDEDMDVIEKQETKPIVVSEDEVETVIEQPKVTTKKPAKRKA